MENHMVDYVVEISKNNLTIDSHIEVGDPKLWIPTSELQDILNLGMMGFDVAGLPNRTRSKALKGRVCEVLGYPVPKAFARSKPRFKGQQFDVYGQKSNNFQVWNEGLSPTRRYVLVRIAADGVVCQVKVVTGDELALLDKTGKLTKKYQARLNIGTHAAELLTAKDTSSLLPHLREQPIDFTKISPSSYPNHGQLLSIGDVFDLLKEGLGDSFEDAGHDQERNRGAALHMLVCKLLGYQSYQDNGQFPDVRHQLIEVKLQTAPTIDLGLVLPSSEKPLDMPKLGDTQIRACDTRYAIFYGVTDGQLVTLTHLFLTTGEQFFERFPQFGGNVLNGKLQIPLPRDFFNC
jgi:hypothetical protein